MNKRSKTKMPTQLELFELWRLGPVITTDCADCGVDTLAIREFYMVTDDTWALAWPCPIKLMPGQQILCIGCLERRIGRTLTACDFAAVPLNDLTVKSARLRDRLTAAPNKFKVS
jgi:hypothetical protein